MKRVLHLAFFSLSALLILSCAGGPNPGYPPSVSTRVTDTDQAVTSEAAAQQPPDTLIIVQPAEEPEEPAKIEAPDETEPGKTEPDKTEIEIAQTFGLALAPPEETPEIDALPEPVLPVLSAVSEPVSEPALPAQPDLAAAAESVQQPTPVSEPPQTQPTPAPAPVPEPQQTQPTPSPIPVPVPTPTPSPTPVQAQTPVPVTAPVQAESPPEASAGEEQPPAIVREPIPRPAPESPAPVLPEPQNEEIVFSRMVRATAGQFVEIPFTGTGWIYLGELASRRGIVYDSRRLDPEGQSFIFRADSEGTYALKFYRQDFIRDFILNDYVQVIVGEAPAAGSGWFNPPMDQGRVTAQPRWPTSLQEAQIRRNAETTAGTLSANIPSADVQGAAQPSQTPPASGRAVSAAEAASVSAGPQTAPQENTAAGSVPPATAAAQPPAAADNSTPEMPQDTPPEAFIQRAKELFDEGKVSSAIATLDQFRLRYPSGSDEAYWLYGQFYEANTPNRDILAALDYYRRLVREYPQSSRFNDARRRISYLERYYINIH